MVHRNRAFAGRLKPRAISVFSQQSADHREVSAGQQSRRRRIVSIAPYPPKHTDVFEGSLTKWCTNYQVCGTCTLGHVQRVLHTLTALPRDAIDLPGPVTEDGMRPLPTETSSRHHSIFHRLTVVSRQSVPTIGTDNMIYCLLTSGSTPANFPDSFQRNEVE